MDLSALTLLSEQVKKLITTHTRLKRDYHAAKRQIAVLEMENKLLEEKQTKAKQKTQQLLDKLSLHEGNP